MNHEAYVGFVDPHTEGDRRHHNRHVITDEPFLVPAPLIRRQTGMIGQAAKSVAVEVRREGVDGLARKTVDDPALIFKALQEVHHLIGSARLFDHFIKEIRPVKAGLQYGGLLQSEIGNDILTDPLGGRCRDRQVYGPRKIFAQSPDLPVLRPKIMAPFRNTMRLVDGDAVDGAFLQKSDRLGLEQGLRCQE